MTREPARPSSGRPGLAEVAALSGVSIKTASRALNGEGYVAEHTRARVQEAAQRLGYRLNGVARELRRGAAASTLVGLLSGDLANPFYSRLASGLERELRRRGMQLITASTDEDPDTELRITESLIERRVRALVVASTMAEHQHLVAERRHGIPIVFVDRPPVGVAADAVLLDNVDGGRLAAVHLLAAGHRRIGLVGDLSRLSTYRDRAAGFAEAMEDAGLPGWRDHVLEDAHDVAAAERAVRALLARPEPPTAIFATNNRITTGAVRALWRHPRPPALIGFDELDLGDVLEVSVLTHEPEEMGRQAAQLLLGRLDGDDGPPRLVLLPTRLIARASTTQRPGPGH
ncbi:LacI family DNA-binding transcriptional regulator [Dactylosporangium salmoneum]|uniref:LacI family DNA-binding transcriptional regulator n=1 Tax=Dactylosporangium salmoneum TaxID=53361 RepID=A0ABP5TBH0_9ACTN